MTEQNPAQAFAAVMNDLGVQRGYLQPVEPAEPPAPRAPLPNPAQGSGGGLPGPEVAEAMNRLRFENAMRNQLATRVMGGPNLWHQI